MGFLGLAASEDEGIFGPFGGNSPAEGIVNSRPIYLRVISDTSFLASRCVNEGFLSLLSRVTPC